MCSLEDLLYKWRSFDVNVCCGAFDFINHVKKYILFCYKSFWNFKRGIFIRKTMCPKLLDLFPVVFVERILASSCLFNMLFHDLYTNV
jgi:hypothetical protein